MVGLHKVVNPLFLKPLGQGLFEVAVTMVWISMFSNTTTMPSGTPASF